MALQLNMNKTEVYTDASTTITTIHLSSLPVVPVLQKPWCHFWHLTQQTNMLFKLRRLRFMQIRRLSKVSSITFKRNPEIAIGAFIYCNSLYAYLSQHSLNKLLVTQNPAANLTKTKKREHFIVSFLSLWSFLIYYIN